MKPTRIEVALFADNRAHDEDASHVATTDGYVCAVVADGVSSSGAGRVASDFAVQTAVRTFFSHYGAEDNAYVDFDIFVDDLWHGLDSGIPGGSARGAETTLTIVVIDPRGGRSDERSWVTAHYVALGDSPIVVCRPRWRGVGKSDLAYLCHSIHDRPLVIDDEGWIYSWVDVSAGRVRGAPSIGSFRLYEGDICLVMTDGIPVFEHIARDVGDDRQFRFLSAVTSQGCEAGVIWMQDLVEHEPLLDDGSMAILHFPEQVPATPKQTAAMAMAIWTALGVFDGPALLPPMFTEMTTED